jgi:hypothetical protein
MKKGKDQQLGTKPKGVKRKDNRYAAKYLAEQREKERPPIMKRSKDDHLDIEHYE